MASPADQRQIVRRGSVRDDRCTQVVRRYLELLPDNAGNCRPGTRSIDHVAAELSIPADSLRNFRDGNTAALESPFVTAFAKILGRPGAGDLVGVDMDDSLGFADPSTGGWYGNMMAEEVRREERLRTFHLINKTRPEARRALSAHADLGVHGNVGEDGRYSGGYEPVVVGGDRIVDTMRLIATNINQHVFPDDQKWLAFRGMCLYGTQYGELGYARRMGRWDIDSLTPRHARTMRVHREDDGSYDPRRAYKQVLPNSPQPVAWFPRHKIAEFKNAMQWGDLYGESIFDGSLRTYIQIESLEASMIIRRLERASLKLKHVVDVGLVDGGDNEVQQHLNTYRARHKKRRVIDNGRGMRSQSIAMGPEEDVIIPKRDKDSPADVSVLQGDAYIEEIGDFHHFFTKWLSALGAPKAHLGYEDEGSKTGVNDKHIVFARHVRGIQLKFIGGLNHLYWVSLILRGIDPRTVRYTIFPPSLGTRDELMRAQVGQAHAATVNYLAKSFALTGKVPSTPWFLKHIMGLDDETCELLDEKKVIDPKAGKAGEKSPPATKRESRKQRSRESHRRWTEVAPVALANPFILEHVDRVRFLLEERAVALRLPEAGDGLSRYSAKNPFEGGAARFDEVVRSLGVTGELHAA